jgi:hypothetical protein
MAVAKREISSSKNDKEETERRRRSVSSLSFWL